MKKFFIIGFILVASCQPVIDKRYDFVPPQDIVCKECVSECLVRKDDCFHSCQRRKERCMAGERIAKNAYQ